MTKRFIIVGCSHSANSGFDKNIHKHYVNLLHNQTEREIVNLSVGGMSNKEIYYRTMEYILTNEINKDDIFIVQWSGLHRLWTYTQNENVDDFTQILPHPCGYGDLAIAEQYAKLHTAYYCNSYVAIKHWLTDMISLQSFFKLNNIDYLFVNGFDNLLSDLSKYNEIKLLSETPLNENLRNILDFDNRPDDYIIKKFNVLITLYKHLNFSNCLKFGSFWFGRGQLDRADDNKHWGEKENALWAEEILAHLKNNNIAV